jgi:hypothetical protein
MPLDVGVRHGRNHCPEAPDRLDQVRSPSTAYLSVGNALDDWLDSPG